MVGGRLLVLGGEANSAAASGVFDDTEAYDPDQDSWAVLQPMVSPRHGTGAAAVGGAAFLPGGADKAGFGAVATVEQYVP